MTRAKRTLTPTPPADPAATATPGRLGDHAYERLRSDVMHCLILPGAEVTEALLAARYGLGKAPIRSALLRLVQEGLAVSLPRRGYQIAPVTIRDIRELFQLRALLEPEAVRLGVPHADVAALRTLDAVLASGFTKGDVEGEAAYLAANRAFHSTLISACNNEKLTRVIDNVIDQMGRLFHLGLTQTWNKGKLRSEHQELVDAVEARDADRAAAIVAEHIETMRQTVIEGVMQHDSLAFPSASTASTASPAPRIARPPVRAD
ncbi:GntR family transcriptional regulator [Variovorax sp. N23]|uniref:GntR family transcriptional regulator n=1 Tax=Variovorax sp. N23 TaxID=2980555 RepID=UPI0021C82ADA|nr:GntR family transcriptional regulator [Variovorax sp. N23]MCU4118787.1 GntR family transcriptional regulator [Variovorax sp. N23]